jgi:hypothetical protein
MKSSRALVGFGHVLLYRICVCFSHFDDLFRFSIFVPIVPEYSKMIGLTTRDANVTASTRGGSRARFLREEPITSSSSNQMALLCSTCAPGRRGASAPYYSMIRICTGNYHYMHTFSCITLPLTCRPYDVYAFTRGLEKRPKDRRRKRNAHLQ